MNILRALTAATCALALLGGGAALVMGSASGQQQQQAGPGAQVDLELVLAVDVSQSMDYDEHTLQRMGYVDAFRHKDVVNAILSGPRGRIAVTVMEWAGDWDPIDIIPWTILDSEAAVKAFADRLEKEPVNGEQRTSISNALYSAADRIERNNIQSIRQAIDVSGDGANNAGPPVEQARDAVLKKNITINGLPIMLNKPMQYYDIDHLDRYYKHCVIGGPASFIVPVFDLKHLASTIRKKLVMEIAGLETAPDMAPIQFADAPDQPEPAKPGVVLAQLKLPTAKTDCFAGEKAVNGMRFQ
ncbi:MAG TPA: DUF1194 domain-containing protein [Hyphomonadaceae bacterium]|jgi:hypothetical protein|nr:DUF1194 domain-containing protein [Hyphomonadaceae bacterium]